jgi:hypothetical protein
VRQVLVAIQILRDKGKDSFSSSDLVAEIDSRLGSKDVYNAIKALEAEHVIRCSTPDKQRWREYIVIDGKKECIYRNALEMAGADAMIPPALLSAGGHAPARPAPVRVKPVQKPAHRWRPNWLQRQIGCAEQLVLLQEQLDAVQKQIAALYQLWEG